MQVKCPRCNGTGTEMSTTGHLRIGMVECALCEGDCVGTMSGGWFRILTQREYDDLLRAVEADNQS